MTVLIWSLPTALNRANDKLLISARRALAQSNEYDPNFGVLFRDRFESP
jgi:hypothetical protein